MGTLWTTWCMIAARVSCVLQSEARLTGMLFTETTEWSPVGPWGPDTKWLWQNCTAPDPAPGFPSPPRLCWEKTASPSAPLSGQCSLKRGKATIEKKQWSFGDGVLWFLKAWVIFGTTSPHAVRRWRFARHGERAECDRAAARAGRSCRAEAVLHCPWRPGAGERLHRRPRCSGSH